MLTTNKILGIIILVLVVPIISLAQNENNSNSEATYHIQKLLGDKEATAQWMIDQVTPGVKVVGDTMYFSMEARRLINEEEYRYEVFKEEYTLLDVKESLAFLDLQKAYWQLINLYDENKEMVLQFIYAYDAIIPVDKIVMASFYTYAYLDPNVAVFENGKPNIIRPDLLEGNFRKAKEIVQYIEYMRENAQAG